MPKQRPSYVKQPRRATAEATSRDGQLQHGGVDQTIPVRLVVPPDVAQPAQPPRRRAQLPQQVLPQAPIVPTTNQVPILFRKPPQYSGATDGLSFAAYKILAEQYILQFACPDRDKLTYLSIGLSGLAQQLVLPRLNSINSCHELLNFLQLCFQPKPKRPAQLVRNLRQQPTESVQNFITRIGAELSACITDNVYSEADIDDYCLEALRTGLRHEYRSLLLRQRVSGFRDAADYVLSVADDIFLRPTE